MNKRMLRTMQGQDVLIWPAVLSLFLDGHIEDRELFPWHVMAKPERHLRLQLSGLGHFFDLPFDNIIEYRENIPGRPAYLFLKSQVWITRCDVAIKPLDWEPTLEVARSAKLH